MSDTLYYVANMRLPTEKAHGIHIMKMCEAFAQVGYEVTLIVPHRNTPIMDDPYKYYNVTRTFLIKKVYVPDTVEFGPFGFLLHYFIFVVRLVPIFVRAPQDTVLYSRDWLTVYAAWVTRRPVFLELHDALKSGQRRFRAALRHATALVTTTKLKQEYYVKNYGMDRENILVFPNAIDPGQFPVDVPRHELRTTLELPRDAVIVGYVGKLRTFGEEKGVTEFVDAFSDAYQQHDVLHLLLVGLETHEADEVKELLSRNSVPSSGYTLVQHVPQYTAVRYMVAADILVLNYPDTPHYRLHMFPLKLCEYMASDSAIISTDLPSVREVLSDKNAVLVQPGVLTALTSAMHMLVVDSTQRTRLALEARNDVQMFSWGNRANTIRVFVEDHSVLH